MKTLSAQFIYRKRFFLAAVVMGSFMIPSLVGCNQTVQEACHSTLPEFQTHLDVANRELDSQIKHVDVISEGRAIASSKFAHQSLSLDQRKVWQEWSERRLKEVQRYMDVVQGEASITRVASQVHNELSTVAKELVSMDGFAEENRPDLMQRSLSEVKEHTDSAVHLVCTPGI